MRKSEFGTTVFEQVPREFRGARRRSPIAFIIVVLVVILFGGFWLYQERTVNETVIPATPENVTSVSEDTSTAPTNEQESSVGDLQAAAVNTAIPDFSKDF